MRFPVFLFVLLAASPAAAQTLLHPMFADHAVFERDQPIAVYGKARPGAGISLQMGIASASAHADKNGQWRTTLPAMPAGGPYTLRVTSGSDAQEIHDVLVGDVFLCTGQSNMQLSVRAAAKAAAEIAAATDDQVRELAVDRVPSAALLTTFTSPVSWKVESPQTAGDFSASCFYFARELRKAVKVPIGLVTVAWGGTRVRGWVSEPTLRAQSFFNDDLDMLALDQRDPVAASRRWDAAWEIWWHGQGKGEPWKEDSSSWQVAPVALGPWNDWPGLSLPEGSAEPGVGFVGQMWLSTHVRLTAAQAAQTATLDLGRANEEEKSWVNGQGVGGSSQQPDARHDLPHSLLHEGDNSITLNIFCSWRNCGLTGPASTRAIRFADGTEAVLDQPWHYVPVETLIAPQIPWGPMHGLGLQYGGMIAPIGPYGVKAAIWYQGESNIYFAQTLSGRAGRNDGGLAQTVWRKPSLPDRADSRLRPDAHRTHGIAVVERARSPAPCRRCRRPRGADRHHRHRRSQTAASRQQAGDRPQAFHRRAALALWRANRAVRSAGGSARRNGDAVTVAFRDVTGQLVGYSGQPNAFELCDASRCRWARATLAGDHVTLPDAGNATRVRYCWGDSPVCTLSDASALPAGPFEVQIQ